jgi:hypothetical protein
VANNQWDLRDFDNLEMAYKSGCPGCWVENEDVGVPPVQ